MQIAFLHGPESEVTRQMLTQLRESLMPHEVLSWTDGQTAPSKEFTLLLSSGGVTKDHIEGQAKLALIQTVSTGYETVDVDAATSLGIWVSYAPSGLTGNATSVAEFAVLLLLAASRQIGRVIASDGRGTISPPQVHAALNSKSVCIVGLGSIGLLVADRLRPFGMLLMATDEHPEQAPNDVTAFPADELQVAVADADFVVICVRASKANQNLISASVISSMKPGAVLVNIARGMLVDEVALHAALESGHISAAGLNVVRQEPLERTNPLLKLPQVLLTPHMAGMTDLMINGTVEFVTQVLADFNAGIRPQSTLNCPATPRKPLHQRQA
jgi:phosphoglycerate dehydrogenase-like enzyme